MRACGCDGGPTVFMHACIDVCSKLTSLLRSDGIILDFTSNEGVD